MRLRVRILDRLIVASFLRIFGGFVIGAPLLFVVGDIVENIDTYIDRQLGFGAVALAYVYKLPEFVSWSFPIAGLLAVIFTVHSMTTHREVMAAKAGGISFHRLVAPLFVTGALLTMVALGLSELVPVGNRRASLLLRDIELRRRWRTDFVYETEKGWAVSARRLTVTTGLMSEVVIEIPPGAEGGPARHIQARSARWDGAQGWVLEDGYMRLVPPEGEPRTFHFMEYRLRGLDVRPELLVQEPKDKEELRAAEIARQAEIIRRSGGDPSPYLLERDQRFAIAAATLVIILFGAPLATSSRRGGAAYGIGIALASTILYMLAFRLSGAAGEAGALTPWVAAWLPNALFLTGGIVLLARVRT